MTAISRECNYEYKPSPQALLHICKTWGVSPSEVIMVGDSAKDDIGEAFSALHSLLFRSLNAFYKKCSC